MDTANNASLAESPPPASGLVHLYGSGSEPNLTEPDHSGEAE